VLLPVAPVRLTDRAWLAGLQAQLAPQEPTSSGPHAAHRQSADPAGTREVPFGLSKDLYLQREFVSPFSGCSRRRPARHVVNPEL